MDTKTIIPTKRRSRWLAVARFGGMALMALFGFLVAVLKLALYLFAQSAEGEDDSATFPRYPVDGSLIDDDDRMSRPSDVFRSPGPNEGIDHMISPDELV